LITAPEDIRIERVMKRDSCTREQVIERLNQQWSDDKKIPLADFVIENSDLKTLSIEIKRLHSQLSSRFSQ
jgi:dephospho-CoA kinase